MAKKFESHLKSSLGQTSLEYILMLIVVVVLVKSATGIIQAALLGDKGQCTDQSTSMICKFENLTNFGDFRYFILKR